MKTHRAIDRSKTLLLVGTIAAGLIITPGSAWSATTNNYVFSYSQTPGFPDREMARLSIAESGADTVWTLSADWDNQYNTSSPFVFSLNYRMPAGNLSQSTLPLFDVTGSITVRSFDNTGVYFQPANTPNRFTDGESASWTFLNTAPAQFTEFELQVNSIYDGSAVIFTDYAVPEPSTYALLAIGALVTVLACRSARGS